MTYQDIPCAPYGAIRATIINFLRNPETELWAAATIFFAVGFGLAAQL